MAELSGVSVPRYAWPTQPLGSLGRWTGGGTPSKAQPDFWADGTIPWVSPKDMKVSVIAGAADLITEEAVRRSSAKRITAGSVLCVMRSGILAHTFPVAVTSVEVTINQDLRALTPREDVDPGYLAHFLRYSGRDILLTCSKHGTTVSSIEASRLDKYAVPIPPLNIQRQIVARIDELFSDLDDGEEELARAGADLATYRMSLLKAAVTGDLTSDWRAATPPAKSGADMLARILADRKSRWMSDPRNARKRYAEPTAPDPNHLPSLPAGWTWASLDQLSWAAGYGTSQKCATDGTGEPVLRIPNLRDGSVYLSDLKRSLVPLDLSESDYVAPGDLLIVRTNGSDNLIGRAGIVSAPLATPTHYASYLIRFRMTGDSARWRWIRAFTESAVFRASVLANIGSSAGQYNLSMSKLAAFPIALPPAEEMTIALDRWRAGELSFDIPATLAGSGALRQSILAAAFRGELA
ncbi:type I restriction enzyme, S subunit [Sphingomonas palmae]|uniref:Type I restriction enzyme, S subunit n=1 Tax=Sphingomonas palmae TaxID=1855283 RepID=A0A1H7UG23_9SPHN|nr:restriction endonuclease subunit S [Sphingomonas palmae]SEL95759.1 type I restriction enzyme, S subunit [Sphingomonas palmae]